MVCQFCDAVVCSGRCMGAASCQAMWTGWQEQTCLRSGVAGALGKLIRRERLAYRGGPAPCTHPLLSHFDNCQIPVRRHEENISLCSCCPAPSPVLRASSPSLTLLFSRRQADIKLTTPRHTHDRGKEACICLLSWDEHVDPHKANSQFITGAPVSKLCLPSRDCRTIL